MNFRLSQQGATVSSVARQRQRRQQPPSQRLALQRQPVQRIVLQVHLMQLRALALCHSASCRL
jgi:hypothetical protein